MLRRLVIKEKWNEFTKVLGLGHNINAQTRDVLETCFYGGYHAALSHVADLTTIFEQTNDKETYKLALDSLASELEEWRNKPS